MNNNKTLGIVAIVAAIALTAMALTVPHQVFAGGHNGYHHNNNNRNSIDVSQQINQLNACQNQTVCLNTGANSADIGR